MVDKPTEIPTGSGNAPTPDLTGLMSEIKETLGAMKPAPSPAPPTTINSDDDDEPNTPVHELDEFVGKSHVVEPWGTSPTSLQGLGCLAGFKTEQGNARLFAVSGGEISHSVTSGKFTFYRVPAFITNNIQAINSYVTLDKLRYEIRQLLDDEIKFINDDEKPGTYKLSIANGVDSLDTKLENIIYPRVRDLVMKSFDPRILGAKANEYAITSRSEHFIVPTFLGSKQHYIGNSCNLVLLESVKNGKAVHGMMKWHQPDIDLSGISAVNRKKGPFLWLCRRMGLSYVAGIKLWLQMKAGTSKRMGATDVVAFLARTNYAPLLKNFNPTSILADLIAISGAYNDSSELNPDTFVGQIPWTLSTPGLSEPEVLRAMQPFVDTWQTPQIDTGACLSKLTESILPITNKSGREYPIVSYNYWHTGVFDPPAGKTLVKMASLPYIKQINFVRNKSAEVFVALNRLDGRLHGQPAESAKLRLSTVFPLALTLDVPDDYDLSRQDPKYWPIELTNLKNWCGIDVKTASELFSKWSIALDCAWGPKGYLLNADESFTRPVRGASLKGKVASIVGAFSTTGHKFGSDFEANWIKNTLQAIAEDGVTSKAITLNEVSQLDSKQVTTDDVPDEMVEDV